jgi:maltose O-acetyltransferase
MSLRWSILQLLTLPLPAGTGIHYRASLMRSLGYRIGRRTTLMGNLSIVHPARARRDLSIGSDCFINVGCVLDLGAPVEIGDRVSLGHQVLIVTASHDFADHAHRAGHLAPAPVSVGHGAWIAARAVLLPGVVVGDGAVVGAGAIVTQSVEPHTVVGGVPAKTIRRLDTP